MKQFTFYRDANFNVKQDASLAPPRVQKTNNNKNQYDPLESAGTTTLVGMLKDVSPSTFKKVYNRDRSIAPAADQFAGWDWKNYSIFFIRYSQNIPANNIQSDFYPSVSQNFQNVNENRYDESKSAGTATLVGMLNDASPSTFKETADKPKGKSDNYDEFII